MGTPESGTSYLPEDIRAALAREPVILGPESIGKHFRNQAELDDVSEFIAKLDGAIAIGLAGSRLKGRFFYPDGQEIFARMCFMLQESMLDLTRKEESALFASNHEAVPERFRGPFDEIAMYLRMFQEQHANLDEIDLYELPESLQNRINFYPNILSMDLEEIKNANWDKPEFLRPGLYFPDIDIAVITDDPKARVSGTFGTRSGTLIETAIVRPFERKSPWPHEEEIIESIIENFRPLTKPTPTE